MQYKKILAAGAMAALMVGASVGFAATLADFPSPFVTTDGMQSLVVVGAAAAPSDVVGAVDVATRLGGEVTTDYTCPGATGVKSVTGEGKEVATTNTKIYLDDNLGKTGARTTMTKDDLATLLANGILEDTDASTTHNYQQFIYLTPLGTAANYRLEWEKPGSSSAVDPTYNFGRFPTTPSTTNYLYRTYVTFDREVNGSTSVGEKVTFFGNEYTIASTTSSAFTGASTDKLVLYGGAQTKVLSSDEEMSVSIGGTTYDVTLVGVSSATGAVVKVGSSQSSITTSTSKKIGGLDVYLDEAYYLSSTDQAQNSAKLLLGAEKITLQSASKVKTGDTDENVDGTRVALTTSSGKLADFTIYIGGKSSSNDYIEMGGSYSDPVWKSFSIDFTSITPALTGSDRSTITISPSGDNLIQVGMTDDRGNEKTINWAYKASSTGTTFSLADNSGNVIEVYENATITLDEYFTVDAGDFTHLYKLTGTSADASATGSIEITDQFSGTSTKITTGTNDRATKVIDGQTYYFDISDSTNLRVNWGTNANFNTSGDFITVFPKLKGRKGEFIAFVNTSTVPLIDGKKYQLPTGALLATFDSTLSVWNFTATTKEDSSAAALHASDTPIQVNSTQNEAGRLSRTATGGTYYNFTWVDNATITIGVGGNAAIARTPGALLVEEKDDSNDIYTAFFYASTETSGSNNVAIPTAPAFTNTGTGTGGVTLGSDSTITDYVDLYGTYVRRTTSGQDTITVYYPDEQVTADVFVLADGASVSTTGETAATTVKQAVPVKTALGKLDTEVTSSDKTNKNLILVGGPAVNTLVKELADADKANDRDWYVAQGAGTGVIELVEDAFTSGKAALVVAGHSAADTRAATGIVQTYDSYADDFAGKMEVVIKNGVISTATA